MRYESLYHVFLVSFPGQGHVSPLLRLGKALASKGLLVTFSVPEIFGRGMRESNNLNDEPTPVGDGFLRFEFFSDELSKDEPRRKDINQYLPHLELVGKVVIPKMLRKNAEEGRPVSCLINDPFVPWVSDVAEELGLPCALLWVHSCACFATYYHCFHGTVPFPSEANPEMDVQLPCMPLLKHDEVPSFLLPNHRVPSFRVTMCNSNNLDKPFCILIDTFEELERDIVDYMSKIRPIKTVGPLFKNPRAETSAIRGNFLKADEDCMAWLDSKPASSVVYVSFGSVVFLEQEQVDEIAHGIINSGILFLWVLNSHKDSKSKHSVLPEGFLEKVGDKGKVVQWSPQEKVLAHPSVACYVTHCGWNSTMETIASGKPVVGFSQFGDQVFNAKYLGEEWKMGIRMCRNGEAENRITRRDEVAKCLLEATVGAKAEEMKENSLKWKKKAEAAAAEGGSSDQNIQAFVDEVRRRSVNLSVGTSSEAGKA